MATKLTNNTQDYKKQDLAKRLEAIANNVTRRGVFVIQKNDNGLYDLLNYLTRKPEISDIPNMHYASIMRDRMNSKRKYNWTRKMEIQRLLDSYVKQHTDCIYYIHTMDNTASTILADVAETRKEFAEAKMAHIINTLRSLI